MATEQIQRSVWKSDRLEGLTRIATLIKMIDGKARIREERLIFEIQSIIDTKELLR